MHAETYLREVADIAEKINPDEVERLARELHYVREHDGRVFVIGFGGSYSNAEHCAADLRKLCEIEAVTPNVAEMSAWINDAGRQHAFDGALGWMRAEDALLVLSVGGGSYEVSEALVAAVDEFRAAGQKVLGIVGPGGGYTAAFGDAVVRVPAAGDRVTPHTESFQAVIWHLLVSHPMLQRKPTKW